MDQQYDDLESFDGLLVSADLYPFAAELAKAGYDNQGILERLIQRQAVSGGNGLYPSERSAA